MLYLFLSFTVLIKNNKQLRLPSKEAAGYMNMLITWSHKMSSPRFNTPI